MKTSLFNSVSLVSGILMLATLTLWIMPPVFDVRRYCISPGEDHISIYPLNNRGSVIIFNDLTTGPPIGLVTGINGAPNRSLEEDLQWRTLGLVYRRLTSYRSTNHWWFISASLFDFVLLFAMPPVVWLVRHRNLNLNFRKVQRSTRRAWTRRYCATP